MGSPRLHADLDPLRRQLGITPRRAPTTPPPIGGPTAPVRPPPPPGPPEEEAPSKPRAAPGARGVRAQGATLTETAGDAAANAVRALPQSPTAAAFGAAQHVVGAGRAAVRSATRIAPRSPLDRGSR